MNDGPGAWLTRDMKVALQAKEGGTGETGATMSPRSNGSTTAPGMSRAPAGVEIAAAIEPVTLPARISA